MKTFPPQPPVLDTSHLVLRALIDDDAAALFEIFSDPATMRYWSTTAWSDPAQARQTIARDRDAYRDGESVRFGMFEGALLVGCCSVHHVDWVNRRAEVGYILRRSHQGRGLMHEAMVAVVGFAFDVLELHRLEADLDPRNRASARTVERLGFAKEGLLRDRWIVDGERSDSLFYGLLRDAWKDRRRIANRSLPDGAVIPTLIYDDVPAATAWLSAVFGFVPRLRAGDGHAQLAIGSSASVMLGASREETDATIGARRRFAPPPAGLVSQTLLVVVDDVDGHHARALASGAVVVAAPTTHAFGERQYTALDLAGHRWTFSQSVADVDPTTWGAESLE